MQRQFVITGIDPVLNKAVSVRVPAESAADAVQLAADCGIYCAMASPSDEADGAERPAASRRKGVRRHRPRSRARNKQA